MRYYPKICLIALFLSLGLFAQTEKEIGALIAHDFERIEINIQSSLEKDRSNLVWTISQILMHKGQFREQDSLMVNEVPSETKTQKEKIMYELINGYYLLYNETNSGASFEYFDRAYIHAKDIDDKGLLKLTLLGFLELYSLEIVQSNVLFENYLREFKELVVTDAEKAWSLYYTNFFHSTSIFQPSVYFETSKKLLPFIQKHKISASLSARFYEDIGLYYNRKHQNDSALIFYKKLMDLPDDPYIRAQKFNGYLDLAELSIKENNREKAKSYFNKAELYYNKSDSIRSYFNLDRFKAIYFYEKTAQYDSAYFALKSSIAKEHKLDYRSNSLKISELNVKLRTAEKEKEIIQKETQINEEKRKKTQLLIGSLSLFSLGSIIIYLVYKNSRKKNQIKEQEIQIERERSEKILKEQELRLIDAMIEGQEKERKLVAEELHDNVASTLSAANIQLNYFIQNKTKAENSEEILKKASDLLSNAYRDVHAMSHEKNSGVIAEKGLLSLVKDLAKNVSVTNKIQVDVKSSELTERLENSTEIKIFRTIQELVNNIVKHAQASEATISMTQHDDLLNIMIEDNGIGFDFQESKWSGIGLKNIERRIESMEGIMEVDSNINRGTTIILEIPI